MNRRNVLKTLGLATGLTLLPELAFPEVKKPTGTFKFCLNTSTIRGQNPGLQKSIEIAARAGFDSVELWVQEVKDFKTQSGSLKSLKKFLDDNRITVED